MSGRAAVGLRLVWAGRGPRTVAVVGGTAVATALLLSAAAIPGAIYPRGVRPDPQEVANVWAVLAFSVVPAVVLLMTASRTSAATRDRRLAALRLLGVSLRDTTITSAVESGALAVVGALTGLTFFLAASPVLVAAVAAGPGWFAAPFTTTPGVAASTVVGVVGALVAVSTLSARAVLTRPIAARAEPTPRRPSRWRLVVPGVAVVLLGGLATVGREVAWLQSNVGLAMLVLGSIAGAVAIATTTPLVTTLVARRMGDRAGPATLLAARAVEVEPGSTARLVSGTGVTVYLVLGALAVLSAFESSPQYRYALQSIRQGPQVIDVRSASLPDVDGSPRPVEVADFAALLDVDGVERVVPHYVIDGECTPAGRCPPEVFVGTCADLAHVMTAIGCQDDRAAAIAVTGWEGTENGWDPGLGQLADAETIDLTFAPNGASVQVDLGSPIAQDSGATQDRWVYQSSYELFLPARLAEAAGALPVGATVIAAGGLDVQQAVTAAAPATLRVEPYPLWDYEAVMRVRTVITTLSALAIGIGLLSLSMTAADRAVERRRAVARHVAIGIPPRTLRVSQLLQTLVPMLVAVMLAVLLGALMVRAFAALAGWPPLADCAQLGLVGGATVIGALLVALATVLLIRTRVTAELLRRE